MSDDLEGISVFLAIADAKSFRVASERLGVTRSAVSQALQRLEDRVGVALIQRTTRSVRMTEAGELFYGAVNSSVSQVRQAMEALREVQSRPSGLLRIAVSSIAESFLSGTLLAGFIKQYPEIALDITVTDEEFDIVDVGFDAAVRLGEVIEQDMIAISVSPEQEQHAFASPEYLAKNGSPNHPRELSEHICIGWRPRPDSAPYRWEFTENGRDFDVAVNPKVTTNDMGLMIRMACAGAGITFGMVDTFQPWVSRGELIPLLEAYGPPFNGFYLYYPKRHRQPVKLRALVDYIRISNLS
ncbi:LysR family transcriptional regulator [Phyllobacterium sp. YR531]|uniref:LysR family transcriptional regulator n=1 Tax=Phyllobacterium sp. YR531 TaxID=1144343 RepID=UPI00026F7E6E|nr:LysR family transcriptional regulator [Phyllobacterium sp. YR531]EJN02087.1 transcriptional regulator [Phyllobacterium sp. YR531]